MPTDSPSTEHPKRRIGGPLVVAVALLAMPMLYALSLGPAARMFCDGTLDRLPAIYAPILTVWKSSPGCGKVIDQYVNGWMPRDSALGPDGELWEVKPTDY